MLTILDCDDVLYDCNEMACKRLNSEYGTTYSINDIHLWGAMDSILDKRFKYFYDPKFIGNLPVAPGAKEFVHQLSQMSEIVVATDVAPCCAAERIKSIKKDFLEISPENVLIGGRKDILNADFMLDDAVHHIRHAAHVRYPVLFIKPWNRKESDSCLSASDYKEFLRIVTEKGGNF